MDKAISKSSLEKKKRTRYSSVVIKFKETDKRRSSTKRRRDNSMDKAMSIGSKNSKSSARMLYNVEQGLAQRTDMPQQYIRASMMVTSRRLGDMKKDYKRRSSSNSFSSSFRKFDTSKEGAFCDEPIQRTRRRELPYKPKRSASLWPIIRNCIGKDINSITIPVSFSEPLTMLQRLAEEFKYTHLLDKAASCRDAAEQTAIVSAFVISGYASSGSRLNKPFVPLLGETYEWDRRDDLGWRLISEQVLHNPPTSVQFCESSQWKCWKTFSVATLFRGKYIKVLPTGMSHLSFKSSGSLFTWSRVEGTINNVLVGKMWLDNVGNVEIVNHTNGSKCVLKFLPSDPANKELQKRVEGIVTDKSGKQRWIVEGKWDTNAQITPVKQKGDNVERLAPPVVLWQCREPSPEIAVYYNFDEFACQLNEPENFVAPTDSRLRNDVRLMENGSWDDADSLKRKLEQREKDEQKKVDYTEPLWFHSIPHPVTNMIYYHFNGAYWKAKKNGDWSKCPNLF